MRIRRYCLRRHQALEEYESDGPSEARGLLCHLGGLGGERQRPLGPLPGRGSGACALHAFVT
jgi:hypothetical protein